MEGATVAPRRFEHPHEHSIGLPSSRGAAGRPDQGRQLGRAQLAVIGVVLTVWLARRRPDKLRDMERVYVEDE